MPIHMKEIMKKEEILERLVKNSLDFLHKAIDELKNYPKFSIIHFHSAVELFLKARLMEEHWTLVISQSQKPDWNKFISGDFISISLDGAADRLEKVVRSQLPPAELKSFREIKQHRNKVVHFFHEDHSDEENTKQVTDIIKQQLTAWYFLHRLLTKRWNKVFGKWSLSISEIDQKYRSLHHYLLVVYDHIKPEIEKRKQAGELFQKCPSCFYESQHHESEEKIVYHATCLVCELSENALRIKCPSCNHVVTFVNDGFGKCENCETSFEPDDLVDELIDHGAADIAATDGDNYLDLGNCSNCESRQTVVRMEDELYICTCCFLELDSLQQCGWCGEPNTGNMEDSLWSGCSHCDGRAGWIKDV